jgi:hypothetical protein
VGSVGRHPPFVGRRQGVARSRWLKRTPYSPSSAGDARKLSTLSARAVGANPKRKNENLGWDFPFRYPEGDQAFVSWHQIENPLGAARSGIAGGNLYVVSLN